MNANPLVLMVVSTFDDVEALADLLPADCRIELVDNGIDALTAARLNPMPDLVLLDFAPPDMEGLEVCRRLKQSAVTRAISVIFVSPTADAAREAAALDLQADDCIAPPCSPEVAQARIRNRLQVKASLGTGTLPKTASPGLGQRQTEVLSLIAEGLTSAQIGVQLSIAKGTVEVHRENIMRKLDVHNIAGLVKYAIRHGLAQA